MGAVVSVLWGEGKALNMLLEKHAAQGPHT